MPSVASIQAGSPSVLGHVNLMVDTLIANLQHSDMQAIARALLATSPPDVTTSFVAAARTRMNKTKALEVPTPDALFSATGDTDSAWKPTSELKTLLRRSRASYGAGMGLEGLRLLTAVVAAAARPGWMPDDDTETILAEIDADLCQAIVSSKGEIDAGRARREEAVDVRRALLDALDECKEALGEAFPFERGDMDARGWKTDQSLGW